MISSDQDPEGAGGVQVTAGQGREGDSPGSLTPGVSGSALPRGQRRAMRVLVARGSGMAESQRCLLPLAHQGTAPFLHMGALAAITALSWIVAGQFARAERSGKYDWAGPAPNPALPEMFPGCPGGGGGPCSRHGPGVHGGLQLQSAVPTSSSASASASVCVRGQGPLSLVTMGAALSAGSLHSMCVLTLEGTGSPTTCPGLMAGPDGT